MQRRRRALLGSLATGVAASIAGCNWRWGPPDDPGDDEEPPEDTTERPGDPPVTTAPDDGPGSQDPDEFDIDPASFPGVAPFETGPRTHALWPRRYRTDDVEVAVGFVEPATPDRPGRVGVQVRNASGFPRTLETPNLPLVGGLLAFDVADEVDHPVAFPPTDDHGFALGAPELERGPKGYWRLADDDVDPYDWVRDRIHLDPGDATGGVLHVADVPVDDASRPTGVFGFRTGQDRLRLSVWDTETPGPSGEATVDPEGVPGRVRERVVDWYHTATPETERYVVPSVQRTGLPVEVDVTAYNYASSELGCGDWQLHKLVGDGWRQLAPVHGRPCRRLEAGAVDRFRLRAYHGPTAGGIDYGDPPDPRTEPRVGDVRTVTRGHLGGGTYAVVFPGDQAVLGTLLEVDAPPVTVAPGRDVTSERDGAAVRVRSPAVDVADRRARLRVTRAGSADTSYVPEQVMADPFSPVRNTVPFFADGVERVRLETSEQRVGRLFGGPGEVDRLAVEGQAYAFTWEPLDRGGEDTTTTPGPPDDEGTTTGEDGTTSPPTTAPPTTTPPTKTETSNE
jgi:hypothetical protein